MNTWLKGGAALLAMVIGLGATPVALLSWGRLPLFPPSVGNEDGSLLLVALTVAG